jgi:hypothetical protein
MKQRMGITEVIFKLNNFNENIGHFEAIAIPFFSEKLQLCSYYFSTRIFFEF